MNATTTHRSLADILADLDGVSTAGQRLTLARELETAVRAQLAPLPDGEAEAMAAQAEAAARTMAPPVPGVTRNGSHVVRAVIYAHPHQDGLLESWFVAAEDPERGEWVTWNAYRRDGSQAGTLSYDAGHYFAHPAGSKVNRRDALADLAVRAGLMPEMAGRIANEVEGYHGFTPREDVRMARRLRKWAGR